MIVRRRHVFVLFAISALVALLPNSAAASGVTITTVASGLKIPRGITFDVHGAMYVAEAGLPGTAFDGANQTGAVDKYVRDENAWVRSWSTTFNSAWTNAHGGTEVLGASGMSARGSSVYMIMALSSHEVPLDQFGHLYRMNIENGTPMEKGDVGDQQWAWANSHKSLWQEFPDTNPYGVLVAGGSKESPADVYVIDAGANTVSKMSADGTTTVIAYIPNETPVAGVITRDSTPTCAAEGPDGALYVGTLDLLRNVITGTQGWSHVYRIDPKAHENYLTAAHLWASGLTTVTSCTFDQDGNFWATEMFKFGQGLPGDVVRIPVSNPSAVQHIGAGQLPFPGGIAQGPDGAMYVTVWSTNTTVANGAVKRLSM